MLDNVDTLVPGERIPGVLLCQKVIHHGLGVLAARQETLGRPGAGTLNSPLSSEAHPTRAAANVLLAVTDLRPPVHHSNKAVLVAVLLRPGLHGAPDGSLHLLERGVGGRIRGLPPVLPRELLGGEPVEVCRDLSDEFFPRG